MYCYEKTIKIFNHFRQWDNSTPRGSIAGQGVGINATGSLPRGHSATAGISATTGSLPRGHSAHAQYRSRSPSMNVGATPLLHRGNSAGGGGGAAGGKTLFIQDSSANGQLSASGGGQSAQHSKSNKV